MAPPAVKQETTENPPVKAKEEEPPKGNPIPSLVKMEPVEVKSEVKDSITAVKTEPMDTGGSDEPMDTDSQVEKPTTSVENDNKIAMNVQSIASSLPDKGLE